MYAENAAGYLQLEIGAVLVGTAQAALDEYEGGGGGGMPRFHRLRLTINGSALFISEISTPPKTS